MNKPLEVGLAITWNLCDFLFFFLLFFLAGGSYQGFSDRAVLEVFGITTLEIPKHSQEPARLSRLWISSLFARCCGIGDRIADWDPCCSSLFFSSFLYCGVSGARRFPFFMPPRPRYPEGNETLFLVGCPFALLQLSGHFAPNLSKVLGHVFFSSVLCD